jgi:hypothetical protein
LLAAEQRAGEAVARLVCRKEGLSFRPTQRFELREERLDQCGQPIGRKVYLTSRKRRCDRLLAAGGPEATLSFQCVLQDGGRRDPKRFRGLLRATSRRKQREDLALPGCQRLSRLRRLCARAKSLASRVPAHETGIGSGREDLTSGRVLPLQLGVTA